MKVGWSFHGHQHERKNYQDSRKSLGFNAYGVDLCNIARFEGDET